MAPDSLLIDIPGHFLGHVAISIATPHDFTFIDHLQRRYVNNTGFVPRTAIQDHIDRQSYHLMRINGHPVGYAMQSGGVRKPLRLIQVAIADDAWRHGLGTDLIGLALTRSAQCRVAGMTATVRLGLPMNQVVTATGAIPVGRDTTPTARGLDRIHYFWHDAPRVFDSHSPIPAVFDR